MSQVKDKEDIENFAKLCYKLTTYGAVRLFLLDQKVVQNCISDKQNIQKTSVREVIFS